MSEIPEIEVGPCPGRDLISFLTAHRKPYGYQDSAKCEALRRPGRRRSTRAYEQPEPTIYTSSSQAVVRRVYQRHRLGSGRLGAAIFTKLLSELILHPRLYNKEPVSSRHHLTSKATSAQKAAPDGHPTERDADLPDQQNDPATGTRTNTNHLLPQANAQPHHPLGSDGESPPPEREPATRSFNQYGPPKTISQINEGVKELLLEFHSADEGSVYGFTHPDDLALQAEEGAPRGVNLIKIGRSVNVQRRMREIREKCEYVPNVVFDLHMPHHHRVEKLVHLQLHNQRLRDVGCRGCHVRHMEWFRVDVEHARDLVSLWQTFCNSRPYDEQGEMLPELRERLEELDMDDAYCWERFITEWISSQSPPDRSSPGIEEHPHTIIVSDVAPSSDERDQIDSQ